MDKNKQFIVRIENEQSIVRARLLTRNVAKELGFNKIDENRVTTVVSELSRNIYLYGMEGQIEVESIVDANVRSIIVTAKDQGPGIKDVKQVMEVGYSTSGGLGAGLPGVKRLMDEFSIHSILGLGTEIVVKKSMNLLKQRFYYEK